MTTAEIKKQLKMMLGWHGVKGVDVDTLTADVERLAQTCSPVDSQPMRTRSTSDTERRIKRLRVALEDVNEHTVKALRFSFREHEAFMVDMALDVLRMVTGATLVQAEPKRRGGTAQWYPMTFGAVSLFRRRLPDQPISTADTALLPEFVALCYAAQGIDKNPTGLKRRINAAWKILRHVKPMPERE